MVECRAWQRAAVMPYIYVAYGVWAWYNQISKSQLVEDDGMIDFVIDLFGGIAEIFVDLWIDKIIVKCKRKK